MSFLGFFPLIFLLLILFNFKSKLLNLLMLESCMLILVSNYYYTLSSGFNNVSICLIMTLFLVLDSVFGLSLLGNSTRFSSFSSPFRFTV